MAIYKILYLDSRRENDLSGIVRTEDNEGWNSLTDALNELSEYGWEINLPIYGPAPGGKPGDQAVNAFILLNRNGTTLQECDRRIEHTKLELAVAQRMLNDTKSEIDKVSCNQYIRSVTSRLQELEEKRKAFESKSK